MYLYGININLMPIEAYMEGPRGKVLMGEIGPGAAGSFSDYSVEPPLVISAICAPDSEKAGVYHLSGNSQAGSALTFIDSAEYSDDKLEKMLTPEDDTYERDIVTTNGRRGRLILKLT